MIKLNYIYIYIYLYIYISYDCVVRRDAMTELRQSHSDGLA